MRVSLLLFALVACVTAEVYFEEKFDDGEYWEGSSIILYSIDFRRHCWRAY